MPFRIAWKNCQVNKTKAITKRKFNKSKARNSKQEQIKPETKSKKNKMPFTLT